MIDIRPINTLPPHPLLSHSLSPHFLPPHRLPSHFLPAHPLLHYSQLTPTSHPPISLFSNSLLLISYHSSHSPLPYYFSSCTHLFYSFLPHFIFIISFPIFLKSVESNMSLRLREFMNNPQHSFTYCTSTLIG